MIFGFNKHWPFSLDVRIKSSQGKQKLWNAKGNKNTSKRRQNAMLQSVLVDSVNPFTLPQRFAPWPVPCVSVRFTSCSFNLFPWQSDNFHLARNQPPNTEDKSWPPCATVATSQQPHWLSQKAFLGFPSNLQAACYEMSKLSQSHLQSNA